MRWAIALGGCLLCGSALAQDAVRWSYTAPPGCPSEQEFRAEVGARLLDDSSPRELSAGDGAELGVEVRLEPAEHRASLVLREAGSAVVERSVEGDTCAELASGLALITALAFGAARAPASAPAEASPRAAASGASGAGGAPAPQRSAPTPTKPNEASARVPPPRDSAATMPSRATPLGFELGAGGWVNTWTTPGIALGGDLFLRLAPLAPRAWSLRATGVYGVGSASVGDRSASFSLLAGRAEACPLSWGTTLAGEACVTLELGALGGRGDASSALLAGASRTVFWAGTAAVGRLRKRLGSSLSLEGQAELGVPLTHHDFVFENPTQRIFRTPPAGLGARLGLGVEFP
jgi:hypothetical protein